ncbi:hypothetical protein PMAYCL1PPCAC_29018, partial [Pristionchus mayeri]
MILYLLFLSLIFPSDGSIHCYVTHSSNYSSNEWTEEKVSCPNTLICLTEIDYTEDWIRKECGPPYFMNCTNLNLPIPSSCANTTISPIVTCCCKG